MEDACLYTLLGVIERDELAWQGSKQAFAAIKNDYIVKHVPQSISRMLWCYAPALRPSIYSRPSVYLLLFEEIWYVTTSQWH